MPYSEMPDLRRDKVADGCRSKTDADYSESDLSDSDTGAEPEPADLHAATRLANENENSCYGGQNYGDQYVQGCDCNEACVDPKADLRDHGTFRRKVRHQQRTDDHEREAADSVSQGAAEDCAGVHMRSV